MRPHEDDFTQCTLTREQLAQLLREFFSRPEAEAVNYTSVFLGRLVEYPWLSRFLAAQAAADPGWDAETGRPRSGDINTYVRTALFSPAGLELLRPVFAETGYRIMGVSVEKVLVAKAESLPELGLAGMTRYPYDALTHLRLVKNCDCVVPDSPRE